MNKSHGDQSFNDRATHLTKNIYGSDKGRLRLMILQRDLAPLIENTPAQTILDAGCGAGLMSAWALKHGHYVTACDAAEVMLIDAKNKLGEHPNITFYHTSIQDLPDNSRYQIIFCHAVLEWVQDQAALLAKLSKLLKSGGRLSLMFYNAWAREMAQLVYGNFDYIDKNYQVRQRVKLSPHWPACPDTVEQTLKAQGLTVSTRSGIRVFYDIIRDRRHYEKFSKDIIRHELRVSRQYPYWQLGRYVHFLATKQP